MEPISAEPIGEKESAPTLNVTGSGSNEGYWSEEDAQIDSAFTKSLGDPQAWGCYGQEYALTTPNYNATGDGEGSGRAIGFQADSDFKLNGVSIMGDLFKQSFDVVIYASADGHTAGSVLATFSATVGGTGLGWNTVPVAFDFEEGDFYFVNWRPTTPSLNWATSIDYYWDTGLPFSVGPLTILDGVSGANAEASNVLHPHFKFLTGADCNCQDNDLATPVSVTPGSSPGPGRAMGFRADRDFTLNAVSIKGDLLELPFEVVIYDSPDGHTAGSVLATFSATAGGTGYDWNVMPVSYRFTRFQYYVVNWRPVTPSTWVNSIDYFSDGGLPATRGPVTIVEGFSGASPDPGNGYHPYMSFCISGDCTVAILGNPYTLLSNNDVKEKLLDTGLFGQVDVINISTETPTLAELQPYASVLVYTDSAGFENSVGLGDNLADYVDGGGGVVTAVFANASIPFAGRFNTDNYWAIPPTGQMTGAASLGAVWSPTHPVLDGVATFSGGDSSYRPDTFSVHAAATKVADWTDGRPLVATRKIGSARRVDLGFYPPSSDARGDFWNAGTDGALLMANALNWASTCVDCDMENFSNPLAQWQNRWLFLNSNVENWYTADGGWDCDPGERGNQPDGIWISDDPGCGNLVRQSPVRIDFENGYGDEAISFSFDQFTCSTGVTFNIYDKDGALVVTEPLAEDCWIWSHFSWPLRNGISAFEYSGGSVEGATSIDNVKLCFPLFGDGFESGNGSAWSASTGP